MAKPMELRGGKKPQLILRRRGRFTKAKQDRFFATLAATCNVSAACRRARVSLDTVYEHRKKSAAFRARWAAAVAEAYAKLELMMIERMMNGTVKTVTRRDGATETIQEYPNHIAMLLLRLHRGAAAEAEAEHDPQDIEEARERLARRLQRLRRRLDADSGPASPAPGGAG
jgi:hypothetical protein